MNKFFLMIILIMLSGCKDKYEKTLDEVTETSMSVRKCELKKLALEKPQFACKKTLHKIAIEKARTLGIKENRINAAINVGILQTDKDSYNLIKKASLLKVAASYKSEAERNREYAGIIKMKMQNYISGGNDFSTSDFLTPNQCKKTVDDHSNWRYVKIKNNNFNEKECIKQLSESQISYEKAARAWLEGATKFEFAADKYKSEY